ncbi:PEP-CTERM sorting domain-containing protein [Colwellia sp. Arc7-635]|nr:PEP-CTERM sorting domain-containing protein [Colwellia sp. Arc7-635]AZQ83800.1 PEP-CTERM sorting domain-containing protein [Colwellia sp. Arc7-635]
MSLSRSSNLLSALPTANIVPTSVPEPTTFALFALTLFGLAARKTQTKK